LEFSKNISEGMLPNRFPDAGEEAEYNTVDATLWYFEAIRAYAARTNDYEFVRANLYEKLAEIIAWHLRGTRYGIRVDTDGLLYAGERGVQLTWMDAKIGDWVVTPRTGKPVEIQALWYNALKIMAHFAEEFDDLDGADQYNSMADAARLSFNQLFWNAKEECLYDVVDGADRNDEIRPNQILAVGLRYAILEGERARKVVQKVESELLTPVGLRSLSRFHPDYRPKYSGSPRERDSAYHQGTVWAWLIGAYVDAYKKVMPQSEKTDRKLSKIFEAFAEHLTEAGIGQISEIFDAESPFAPRGCIAQAWSIAEVLRVWRQYFEKSFLPAGGAKRRQTSKPRVK
jgi:predicted glycogen debranching enzyme